MKYDGINFNGVNHLHFRPADPTRDFDEYGIGIDGGRCIFIRLKDCLDENGVFQTDLMTAAPGAFIHAHSLSNMAYGKTRIQKRGSWFWVRLEDLPESEREMYDLTRSVTNGHVQKWFETYKTHSVYLALNGQVYQGTIREPN